MEFFIILILMCVAYGGTVMLAEIKWGDDRVDAALKKIKKAFVCPEPWEPAAQKLANVWLIREKDLAKVANRKTGRPGWLKKGGN